MLETLEKVVVKEKYPGSSFLALHACNSQHEWLILPFGIGSSLLKLYVLRRYLSIMFCS